MLASHPATDRRPVQPFRPDIDGDLTRRRLLGGAGGLSLAWLAGCASDEAAGDGPGATPTPSATAILRDDRGEVPVAGVPARIVSMSEESTELLVALGLKPIGFGSYRVDDGDAAFAGHYLTPDQIGSPQFVGGTECNFEAITALQPDLIIEAYESPGFATLREIAPTAVYDVQPPDSWKEALRRLGEALGRTAQAEAAIAEYEQEVAASAKRVEPIVLDAPRISVIYPNYRGGAENYVYGRDNSVGGPLADLGFAVVGVEKSAIAEGFDYGTLSLELLGTLETDTVLSVGATDWRDIPAATVLSGYQILSAIASTAQPRGAQSAKSSPWASA